MTITLKPIDESNFLDAFHLQLRDDQTQYVSHPIRSLAQAYVYRDQCQPFGIYADARMVGYVMAIYDYDVPEYDIWHMMIDAAEQGKGYGTAAMQAVLDYIATKPFGDSGRVVLTCHQANIPAMRLYESLGFQHTGNVDEDGEEEMVKGCVRQCKFFIRDYFKMAMKEQSSFFHSHYCVFTPFVTPTALVLNAAVFSFSSQYV